MSDYEADMQDMVSAVLAVRQWLKQLKRQEVDADGRTALLELHAELIDWFLA